MAEYALTETARADIKQVLRYGARQFGLEQAHRYQQKMKQHFARIAEHPLHYQACEGIVSHYRRSAFRSHVIYYRIEGNGILIVRVLGAQEMDGAISPEEESP